MRFLVDETADARVASHLRSLDHDAKTVAGDYPPGLPVEEVLAIARGEQPVLITDDSDFGDLVFRHRAPHAGVIFFRLDTTILHVRLDRLDHVLANFSGHLDQFLVVTRGAVRVGGLEPGGTTRGGMEPS